MKKKAKRIRRTLRCTFCSKFAVKMDIIPGSIGQKVPLCKPHWESA